MNALCRQSKEYRAIRRKLGKDFARKWFAKRLTEIQGVGPVMALALFSGGFRELSDVRDAEDPALLRVPGVGPGTLKNIRAYFGAAPPEGSPTVARLRHPSSSH